MREAARDAACGGLLQVAVLLDDHRGIRTKLEGNLLQPGQVANAQPHLDAAGEGDNRDALVELRSSPEGQEGLSAFLEKRPAAWIIAK